MFECKVGGTPEISVHWFRHGAEIHQSVKHKMSFFKSVATLEICQVSENDSGNYFCKASNEVGTESFTVELKVKGWFSFTCLHVVLLLSLSSILRPSYKSTVALVGFALLFQSLLRFLKSCRLLKLLKVQQQCLLAK